jgi:hypothetical protein
MAILAIFLTKMAIFSNFNLATLDQMGRFVAKLATK